MTRLTRIALFLTVLTGTLPALAAAQASVAYRLSFPEPEHRWMQVEATFPDLPAAPLELHMSRSSPGRYALHEFAKNVFEVEVTDSAGAPLDVSRPNPQEWRVATHGATVRVRYRVFGDRVDGTYLAVDTTHAHVNMPAAFMWARGLEDRPITVRFDQPAGAQWRVATQLFPAADPLTYTAPNLQYLMDSPSEFSTFALREFTLHDGARSPTFRIAAHHLGTDGELDAFAKDVEAIVSEARKVFGEFAAFEGNTYTFIADYLPWASGDGMEHRNSTIVTSSSSLRSNREGLLSSMSHEFFHSWNVERIRPLSLEPFNFDEANMSGELWLAEGFTNYYGPLVLARAGLTQVGDFAQEMGGMIDAVVNDPGRRVRTAEEMSRFAPFVDAASAIDRTNFENTFISYYTWGGALGIGLDLTLRDRTDGKVTLDHFMRALWQRYGKPGGRAPGYVDHPYTMTDLRSVLAAVSGDPRFADDFFARYIQGHDVLDYARLLGRAGLVLQPVNPGQAFAGLPRCEEAGGQVRVAGLVPWGSPAYAAGLERDDVIVSIGASPATRPSDVEAAIRSRRPGSTVPIVFERRGRRVTSALKLIEDPRQEVVLIEQTGRPLPAAQKRFRDAWLGSPN